MLHPARSSLLLLLLLHIFVATITVTTTSPLPQNVSAFNLEFASSIAAIESTLSKSFRQSTETVVFFK
jgi:hypothetical protein